jgi:hypothetical protein
MAVPSVLPLTLQSVGGDLYVSFRPGHVTIAALIALVVFTSVAVTTRGRSSTFALRAAPGLAIGALVVLVFSFSNAWIPHAATLPTDDGYNGRGIGSSFSTVRNARHLAWQYQDFDPFWEFDYQFLYDRTTMQIFTGDQPPPGADVVLAPGAWKGAAYGYRSAGVLPENPGRSVWVRG